MKKYLYWLIPIASIIMQLAMNQAGAGHIRPEEISESVRGPYWFIHGRIFQGLSSHIGWYAQLVLWYDVFGFTLRGAADYRFVLHIISVMSLAFLLKKYLGEKFAWLPLAAYCFSPTLFYFNSLATHFGIDLQYIPICLILLDNVSRGILFHIAYWMFIMIAWMSYPTMVYYLPVLAILYVYTVKNTHRVYIGVSIVSFLLPLIVGFLFVQNRSLLLYDASDRSGIFRGTAHTIDLSHGWDRVRDTALGFFTLRPSYYWEIEKVEFSDMYPMISLVGAVILLYFSAKKYRKWILIIGSVVVLNVLTIFLFSDTGGAGYASIRRATGLVASVYMFLILACYVFKNGLPRYRWVALLFFLIPMHHVMVYLPNMNRLIAPSRYDESTWFRTKQTITESLDAYVETLTKNDIRMTCPYESYEGTDCSYNRLYVAVSASCYWNHRTCYQLWGWDPFRETYERLRMSLWDNAWKWEKYDIVPGM